MKMSNSFFYTRREFPKDETTISSKLLIKSGFVYKNSSGIYSYTPIGNRVLCKIKNIIRDEFNKNRTHEVVLPSLLTVVKLVSYGAPVLVLPSLDTLAEVAPEQI